ncbi:hypothetical protein BH10BAC2_BH10BAC2_45900 [soil metagenome]
MRTSILCICIFSILICGCSDSEQKKLVKFKPLTARQFNFSADTSFSEPQGKAWEERKKMHDSCMGETFAANAVFIRTADTIRLGTLVDMKTMKVVKELGLRSGIPVDPGSAAFTFMTKPCYEKWEIDIQLDAFFKRKIEIVIPGADETVNKELNLAISNSVSTEMETGSWINIELTDAFGKILDTTTNPELLEYKKYLIDSANMILIKSSSITDISFYINTAKPMSAALQQVLSQKPVMAAGNGYFKTQLFFISSTSLQLKFNGIFQVMGQFMQGKLE